MLFLCIESGQFTEGVIRAGDTVAHDNNTLLLLVVLRFDASVPSVLTAVNCNVRNLSKSLISLGKVQNIIG